MTDIVDWTYWGCEWAWLNTKYGKMLGFNGKVHNEQYEILSYQDEIVRWLESKRYDVFIDVGSEIGIFSIVAANYCRKVIAYEASPFLYGILLYNMRYCKNVECRYGFVSKIGDVPKMHDQVDMIVCNGAKEYNIPIVELDRDLLGNEWITPMNKIFIKMDIEGSELNALSKAIELEKMTNIDWTIDVHKGITSDQVVKFFPNRNIKITDNVIEVK